ncbi:hypothetical protein H0H93_010561 [Arthromyces matolae]|nr:hypothetical protein H0H93_010561 [Arthromyces matolae]
MNTLLSSRESTTSDVRTRGIDNGYGTRPSPESNFLDLAFHVSVFLEHYAGDKVPHAFGGDIVKAYNAKSPSGPFHTVTLIMEHKFLPVAEKALKAGYQSPHGWSLQTKTEENGEKVILSRKDRDDVSAGITFIGIDQEIEPQLVQMPGHPTVYLPILIDPKKFPFNLLKRLGFSRQVPKT